ncbi:MAG TPA: PA14 domain-containing protein [Pirellulaceae bacterium]|jgi:mono/diheme cytochrome c family protein
MPQSTPDPFSLRRISLCRFLMWGFLLSLSAAATSAADAPPRVLGYERVYASPDANGVAAGQLLLGELNCTACHAAPEAAATQIDRKSPPILDTVASRVRLEYLHRFLADPQATKPGTTMPNVLADKSEAERAEIVDTLVHFLARTGNATVSNPSRFAVKRGEELFHSIGCVACHDPRTEKPPEPVAASIPLGTPSKKYTLPGLTQFLQEPLAIRPGGRMPDLNLTSAEARDIASFLLNDLDIVAGLQYAYYEGEWEKLPKFETLKPVATGEAENFDLTPARRKNHFALRFEGTIELPQAGDYLFLIGSDDGSRLLIDGKVVVVTDGVHPFEQKRKKQAMTAGPHSVVVEYFEDEGEESLQVDFEGPGMTQQPLAALLTSPTKQSSSTTQEAFAIDASKAAKGREYFASFGCASCHLLREKATPMASTKTAKPLVKLTGSGGCLDRQSNSTPKYGLSDEQAVALGVAISALKEPARELAADVVVNQELIRFNCVACHQRGNLGGILAARDSFFVSDMPEMGDEGRIPPSLNGVGAKLTSEWLDHIFAEGAKDRPYMLTRMPKFGTANVGSLTKSLELADVALVKAAPPLKKMSADDERRIKAGGRRLVGTQGFSCIKCHTFADQRSSGIQALSLTTMTKRLRHDWFYHYLQNPLAYRPGTRMPTAFPDGQTTLPKVLDGTVDSQIEAIWRYLSDGDKAIFPVGLVTGKIELVALDEPIVYRNFIEGAGTRAIGVGYPEKLNLAFDANNMRLALLWHGAFIDAARHWTARGAGFEKPLGDNVLKLPDGPALAILKDLQAAWPTSAPDDQPLQFRGYRLGSKRQPIFLYSWNGLEIEDTPRPVGQDDVFTMQRKIIFAGSKPIENAYFRAARANRIEQAADDSYRLDNRWTLHTGAASNPVVREVDGEQELLVPIVLTNGNASIELNYDW